MIDGALSNNVMQEKRFPTIDKWDLVYQKSELLKTK